MSDHSGNRSVPLHRPLLPAAAPRPGAGLLWRMLVALSVAYCVLFGLLAIQQGVGLTQGELPWWTRLQTWLTSFDYSQGPRSVQALMNEPYRQAGAAMTVHMALAGLALTIGVFQFIPALRHRWVMAHRLGGLVFVLATLVSMVGAIWFLVVTPMKVGYSGPAFAVGLWSLAFLTLGTLTQAGLAIWSRDYRSHMGWMAVTYAALLTAPVLRLEWTAFGWFSALTLEQANLAIALSLVPQCLLPMALWMAMVGAREFPAAPGPALVPASIDRGLAGLAAAVVVIAGVLAPFGLDLLGPVRAAPALLPPIAIVWGLTGALAAWQAPAALRRLHEGKSLEAGSILLAAVTAGGALLIAFELPVKGPLAPAVQPFFWGGYGIVLLLLAVLALRARPDGGARAGWGIQLQYLLLAPAMFPLLGVLFTLCGLTYMEALSAAQAVGSGLVGTIGFASAYGLVVRVPGLARAAISPALR